MDIIFSLPSFRAAGRRLAARMFFCRKKDNRMGPTNVALVKLFEADQKLRAAQSRLDATTRNVRVQERRSNDLAERIRLARLALKEQQAKAAALDLDLRTRDARIERLRVQQQDAKNNNEYQAFLIEINTGKVDRNKIEEEAIAVMEANEKAQGEIAALTAQLEAETSKLATMKTEIGGKSRELEAEIEALRPEREAAAAAVPASARTAFDRLADRFEGEAMSAISKPDRRREEYACSACNMDLVRDVYNRLHTRDELVFCPSCRRILYIPEELPPEMAVHRPKEKKERSAKAPPAAVGRQTSAVDVLRSVTPETEQPAAPESENVHENENAHANENAPGSPPGA
jgi:predicted  nucleic acid-binding Zn-ribbon protein